VTGQCQSSIIQPDVEEGGTPGKTGIDQVGLSSFLRQAFCKAVYAGSIPTPASNSFSDLLYPPSEVRIRRLRRPAPLVFLKGQAKAGGLDYGEQRGKPRVALGRERTVEALARDPGGFGHARHAARLGDRVQRRQQYARVVVLDRGHEIRARELGIGAQLLDQFGAVRNRRQGPARPTLRCRRLI